MSAAAALAQVQAYCAAGPVAVRLALVPELTEPAPAAARPLPPFRARCARGHDPVTFEGDPGKGEFEEHMRREHPAGRGSSGPDFFPKYNRPALFDGKPYPWVAPRPVPADVFERKLAAWQRSGELVSAKVGQR